MNQPVRWLVVGGWWLEAFDEWAPTTNHQPPTTNQETRDYDAHPTISDPVIRIVIAGSVALVLARDHRATEGRDQREALRLLAARQSPLGEGRLLRLGQPGLERIVLPARAGPVGEDGRDGRRLSGRGAGSELHLHRADQAADRIHDRHSPRLDVTAPDVQSPVHDVAQPRRVSLEPLRAPAAQRSQEMGRPPDPRLH